MIIDVIPEEGKKGDLVHSEATPGEQGQKGAPPTILQGTWGRDATIQRTYFSQITEYKVYAKVLRSGRCTSQTR